MFNATELSFFLIDNIRDGIIIMDEELSIVYLNRKAENYLKLNHNEIMGKNCEEIFEGLLCKKDSPLYKALYSNKIIKETLSVGSNLLNMTAYAFKGIKEEKSYRILLFYPESHDMETVCESNYEKKDVEIRKFVESVIKEVNDLAVAKNIVIATILANEVSSIFINEQRMRFVFINLLSKAINFVDRGRLVLRIYERETGNSDIVSIENELPLKDAHYQALTTSFSKGTDKAKNIIEEHGGKLWLNSENGFSINFTIPKNLF